MSVFAQRLKELRKQASQRAFSQILGVNQQKVSRWETGRFEPSLDEVITICNSLHVSADWLLGLSDSRGVSITATDHSVAANNSTVSTPPECATLLRIIESQQRVIEKLAGAAK